MLRSETAGAGTEFEYPPWAAKRRRRRPPATRGVMTSMPGHAKGGMLVCLVCEGSWLRRGASTGQGSHRAAACAPSSSQQLSGEQRRALGDHDQAGSMSWAQCACLW